MISATRCLEIANVVMVVTASLVHFVRHARSWWRRRRVLLSSRSVFCLPLSLWERRKQVASARVAWLKDQAGRLCAGLGFIGFLAASASAVSPQNWAPSALYFATTIAVISHPMLTDLHWLALNSTIIAAQFYIDVSTINSDPGILVAHLVLSVFMSFTLDLAISIPLGGILLCGRAWMVPQLLALQVGFSIAHGRMLLDLARREMRLQSEESAGHATTILLTSRYDAVVVLDEEMRVTAASRTFFGLTGDVQPVETTEWSRGLHHLQPPREDQRRPGAAGSLRRFPFADKLRDPPDVAALANAMRDQRCQWQRRHGHVETVDLDDSDASGALEDSPARSDSKPVHLASVLSCTFSLDPERAVRFQLMVIACFNADTSKYSFFVGMLALEEIPVPLLFNVPEYPVSFTIDATSSDLVLLSSVNLGGVTIPAGAKLNQMFRAELFSQVRSFLHSRLADYRAGRLMHTAWSFGQISAQALNGASYRDSAVFELLLGTAGTVLVTIHRSQARVGVSCGRRSSRSPRSTCIHEHQQRSQTDDGESKAVQYSDGQQQHVRPDARDGDSHAPAAGDGEVRLVVVEQPRVETTKQRL